MDVDKAPSETATTDSTREMDVEMMGNPSRGSLQAPRPDVRARSSSLSVPLRALDLEDRIPLQANGSNSVNANQIPQSDRIDESMKEAQSPTSTLDGPQPNLFNRVDKSSVSASQRSSDCAEVALSSPEIPTEQEKSTRDEEQNSIGPGSVQEVVPTRRPRGIIMSKPL